ncbi:AAA family ATPase [Pseudolabrys sp. FHR47]|uniref:bifunctional aminoglycoside phosphotransferase/ATP-binding protein n=1 Tax=Pseudolabrys sp. FHR47 TaxID=2562284 RepID=UPI0010BF0E32|nr:AAA family ATPase [Pseudolabrys sp. FHR47]
MDSTDQQPVFDFLATRERDVKRIDTHAASVFLSGDRALKVKRAVRFLFLDFSTLEKRKAACEAEIEVNKPYAPKIYRGVVAITREADSTLAINGKGTPVEYAVDMARFDETQTLDHVADRDDIGDALADRLGRAVARAHKIAPVKRDANFVVTLDEIIAQNDAELGGSADLFEAEAVKALTTASRAALDRLRPLLETRERDGSVRRCHGDLHLGNLVLIDNEPMLFDAIEFNDKLAIIDRFYDLAFLLMDLIERDLAPAATIVLNRYITETGEDSDLDALALLPLFMSLRAAIRAKVTAARPKRDAALAQRARDYFALAQRLIAPPPPRLIAVGGLSGTGKSVLARALTAHAPPLPGAVWLRSDVIRKRLLGKAETEKLPPEGYTADVTARVYEALGARAARVIAAGHSAIADAVFARAGERADIERAAPQNFHSLFLTADLETRLARVGGRSGDASDADAKIARAQEDYDLGDLRWTRVDASGSPEETLRKALREMPSP